jgi:membrane-associated HD superfamily phosphohydrolase
MSRLLVALLVTAGLGVVGCAAQTSAPVTTARPALVTPAPISKDAYDAAVKNAEAQYKSDKDLCASRGGNAKDICLEQAKARQAIAKADAEAAYKNTPKAIEEARVVRAEANYSIAKQRCDDLAGNAKDVCLKDANAALVAAKADAKVDRVATDSQQESAKKLAEARQEAAADWRDADYKAAVERCDALNGPAKDTCISDAKLRFGK